MKRCNNCGWTNNDNPARCGKCNHLLANVISEPETKENNADKPEGSEPLLSQTLMGKQASDDFLDKQNLIYCSECGYPNRKDLKNCLRCNHPIPDNEQNSSLADKPEPDADNDAKVSTQETTDKEDKAITVVETPGNKGSDFDPTKTYDPYRMPKQVTFHLEPMVDDGKENKVLIEFKGNNVPVNRESLEPGNKTITSKTQAEIIFDNGVFLLTDKSQQQTTFLQVNKPTKIKNGDIILMGNRKFKFYSEDSTS